eukprot:TRINITY_DN6577_c3_g1_i1.p1 TRINITY_DN6577_c3_g1~~TRINITY_DN6577_c3_g1_i1.p1  ORF type:complete len:207 (-),score=53.85 TRINITY_DN6577_c3_g1_i1:67-687(-)
MEIISQKVSKKEVIISSFFILCFSVYCTVGLVCLINYTDLLDPRICNEQIWAVCLATIIAHLLSLCVNVIELTSIFLKRRFKFNLILSILLFIPGTAFAIWSIVEISKIGKQCRYQLSIVAPQLWIFFETTAVLNIILFFVFFLFISIFIGSFIYNFIKISNQNDNKNENKNENKNDNNNNNNQHQNNENNENDNHQNNQINPNPI